MTDQGSVLVYVFWAPPPPINFVHDFLYNFKLNLRHVRIFLENDFCTWILQNVS